MPTDEDVSEGRRLWVVAPDSFKGTFDAGEVAKEIVLGLREAGEEAEACPLADGGEGTVVVLLEALGGEWVTASARDPLGRQIDASFALIDDGTVAVVETAEASGLCLVSEDERDPEGATSAGTGDLIIAAREEGADRVMLGVGGSATTDGGKGAIEAVEAAGGLGGMTIEVLCDTTVSFERAAEVFGAQKGADEAVVAKLRGRLERQAAALPRDPTGVPMTGAAGGLAGGLWAALGATLRPGAQAVLDAVGFDARLGRAKGVVTGEGRLDRQSLEGKLVGEVCARAFAMNVPVHAIVGTIRLRKDEVGDLGLSSVSQAGNLEELRAMGRALGARSG